MSTPPIDPAAWRAAALTRAATAVTKLNTMETLLTGAVGRFDAATPAQRDDFALTVVRDLRAIINALMDSP